MSVSLRMPLSQNEGDDIEVCMDLSSEPSGGRECDVTATLSVTDGTATGEIMDLTLQGYESNNRKHEKLTN